MSVAARERAELSELFDELGPGEPTLCEGWTTGDLVAHLLVRERRPDAAGGILIPALAKRTERVMASISQATPYAAQVELLRNGPPTWSPWAIPVLGDRGNTAEFFVHHEDVRRAQPEWEPRPVDAAREDALWKTLHLLGRMLYRKAPVTVVAKVVGHDELVLHKGRAKRSSDVGDGDGDGGGGKVVLVGAASEIVLHAFGRPASVVRVVFQGDPDDLAALAAAHRGL